MKRHGGRLTPTRYTSSLRLGKPVSREKRVDRSQTVGAALLHDARCCPSGPARRVPRLRAVAPARVNGLSRIGGADILAVPPGRRTLPGEPDL